jgi:hypothetical protein
MVINLKNTAFWYVTPCDSYENRHISFIIKLNKISELGTELAVTTDVVVSALIFFTLMTEAIRSSQMSLTTATRRHIPEDDILHSHRRESLKPYLVLTG